MEPALHIDVGLVLQRPLLTGPDAEPDGEEVNGEGQRDGQERDNAAGLGPAGEFIQEDKAEKNDQQHPPLGESVFAVDLEKHCFRF